MIALTWRDAQDDIFEPLRTLSACSLAGRIDRDRYRGRNVVERGANRLKQWRGIATRYDSPGRDPPGRSRRAHRVCGIAYHLHGCLGILASANRNG